MRVILFLAALLSGDEFADEAYGFRISKPADWVFQEGPESAEADSTLWIYPKGKSGTGFTVYVNESATPTDADSVRKLREAALRKDGRCSKFRSGESTVAGRRAPWLRFDYAGTDVRQHYVVEDGLIYTLQSYGEMEDLDAILKSFALVPANPRLRTLRKLSARCGSEIDWARDWEEAAKRARASKRLVLVVVENYWSFRVPPRAPATAFMDPDVVALVRERFVGLRWKYGMTVPFQDPAVYGMGPSTFGGGLLFVEPEGRVVAEGCSFAPIYVDECARRVLGRGSGNPKDPELLLRRGELDAAWEMLKQPTTAHGWRLQAQLLRRLRLGDQALAAIRKARKLEDGSDPAVDEAVILLRMGRGAEAAKILRAVEPRSPEARYWLGATGATEEWEELIRSHRESRWAWKAAANLSGRLLERTDWPSEEILILACDSPPESLPLRDAERGAVRFLLAAQRPDGSWPTPPDVSYGSPGWTTAVTAICASSLMRFPEARKAVDRALEFVIGASLAKEKWTAFDMSAWGRVFGLRFLARCAREGIGDRARIVRAMDGFVRDLRERQARAGGWAYVDMEEAGGAKDPSISFITAAAVLALLEAKETGAQVPRETIDRAVECVRRMRGADGSFGYMGGGSGGPEASLRGPLCALALVRGGKGDGVRTALDLYLRHRRHVAKERGKVLCHTGPEGTASYYLLYGFAFAAEALGELPAQERRRYREALLEDVLAARRKDGGFVDNPMTGRAYGAAMALLALERLSE
ncbi:MAG: hypothetical protein HYY17_14350 [Planctomycetes bacterium]|nr:hypothetical protein [Planctomycetota bacterium]